MPTLPIRGSCLCGAVRFEPEPPWRLIRSFCGRCGTFLGEPDTNAEGGGFPIAASALDDDPGLRIVLHECVAEKPAWLDIADGAHQLQGPAEDAS